MQGNEKKYHGLTKDAQARNTRQEQTVQVQPLPLPEVEPASGNRQQEEAAAKNRRKQISESQTAPTVMVIHDCPPEQTQQESQRKTNP
jgi:hypothetical protein